MAIIHILKSVKANGATAAAGAANSSANTSAVVTPNRALVRLDLSAMAPPAIFQAPAAVSGLRITYPAPVHTFTGTEPVSAITTQENTPYVFQWSDFHVSDAQAAALSIDMSTCISALLTRFSPAAPVARVVRFTCTIFGSPQQAR
jgi:hypothetical protein